MEGGGKGLQQEGEMGFGFFFREREAKTENKEDDCSAAMGSQALSCVNSQLNRSILSVDVGTHKCTPSFAPSLHPVVAIDWLALPGALHDRVLPGCTEFDMLALDSTRFCPVFFSGFFCRLSPMVPGFHSFFRLLSDRSNLVLLRLMYLS